MVPFVIALPAFADSPLTSTEFSTAYAGVALVEEARAKRRLDPELAAKLASPGVPLDVKVAAVNAIGWNFDGKQDAEVFARALGKRSRAKAEDALVMGYLVAMDDYFHPEKAFSWLAKARAGLPRSYTVAVIDALVHAQKDMDTDFCAAWRDYAAVADDPRLVHDLRPAAEAVIAEYMGMYSGGCR